MTDSFCSRWLTRLREAQAPWWINVLGLSALLALALGLRNTVNLLADASPGELAAQLFRSTAAALVAIVPGLMLVEAVGRRRVEHRVRHVAALVAATLAAALMGILLQDATFGALALPDRDEDWDEIASSFALWWRDKSTLPPYLTTRFVDVGLRFFTLAAAVAVLRELQRHSVAASAALHGERLRNIALQGQLDEAQLRMLQAQIEPHFLFNSLANVRRLTRIDRDAGAMMLADLLRYFETTLPCLRSNESTLAHEVDLARAFLAVYRIRMAGRLAVEFEVPAELAATPVPPMMLLTLVENALKHGLGPLPEGGRIRICARSEGGSIHLSVADTGRGLVPGRGEGVGLANIRARLRSSFGSAAKLTLRHNDPRGMVASIVLPAHPP